MTLRQVIHVPHPALRKTARPVVEFDSALDQLLEDMVETMQAEAGVGLAGPQIDVNQRVIVVQYGDENNPDLPPALYTLVNPRITNFSEETAVGAEACLSIPDLMGDVERAVRITLEAQNRRGEPIKMKPRGWLARIFQHEVDHLDGILFTDRAEEVWEVDEPEEDYHTV